MYRSAHVLYNPVTQWSFVDDYSDRVTRCSRNTVYCVLRSYGLSASQAERVLTLQKSGPLAEFLKTLHKVDGALIPFRQFRAAFVAWLPDCLRPYWTRYRLSRELKRLNITVGKRNANKTYVANLDFAGGEPGPQYIAVTGGRLTTAINSGTNSRSRKQRTTARTKTARR